MLPPRVLDLFAVQYGHVAKEQLRNELTNAERKQVYRHPEVERVTSRVLHHRATGPSLGAQLILPVLHAAPGGRLWDVSAALWWGFGRDRAPVVHVARHRYPVPDPIGRVHYVSDLDPEDTCTHRGIPIARPERVILGIAATETHLAHPTARVRRRDGQEYLDALWPAITRTELVLEHAWRLGLIDGNYIHKLCERESGRGHAGIVVLRALLKTRPPDHRPTESGLELRFESTIGAAASQLERQITVDDGEGRIGRVDYMATKRPLVFEINGEAFHTSTIDRDRDERRYERLIACGLSVVVLWQYDVWHDAGRVAEIVRHFLMTDLGPPQLYRPTSAPWELLHTP